MELKTLKTIFITHLHSDHYLELGPLIHTAWTAGLKTPVAIWGPAGLIDYWEGFLTSMKADIDLRIEDEGRPDLRALVSVHVIDAGPVTTCSDIEVSAIRNEHPPLADSFALSFKCPAAHVVLSGDTAALPALEDFARGADLLVHEAMLEAALPALFARVGNGSEKLMEHFIRAHTTAHAAADTARAAGVKALALHLIPSDDPDFGDADWHEAVAGHWDGQLHIGKDGLRIPL